MAADQRSRPTCVVFGATDAGACAAQALRRQFAVLGIADNDVNKHGRRLAGFPIIDPNTITPEAVQRVVIASRYGAQMSAQLRAAGIPAERIVTLDRTYLRYLVQRSDCRRLLTRALVLLAIALAAIAAWNV